MKGLLKQTGFRSDPRDKLETTFLHGLGWGEGQGKRCCRKSSF